uniref:Uncharacterized protein n=1 Tax=Peronospora matthiolae TaxID=2874970 RepID=A0AAV1T8M6_9STRA
MTQTAVIYEANWEKAPCKDWPVVQPKDLKLGSSCPHCIHGRLPLGHFGLAGGEGPPSLQAVPNGGWPRRNWSHCCDRRPYSHLPLESATPWGQVARNTLA